MAIQYEVLVAVFQITERRKGCIYKTKRLGVKWVDWNPDQPSEKSSDPDLQYVSPSDEDFKEAGIQPWQTPRRKAG